MLNTLELLGTCKILKEVRKIPKQVLNKPTMSVCVCKSLNVNHTLLTLVKKRLMKVSGLQPPWILSEGGSQSNNY